MSRPVYLVDGARTPFLKARGAPGPFSPVDLAVQCGRPLLARQPDATAAIELAILGCVNVVPDEMNPARIAALRLGLGDETVAYTVQINCGSGMQSIDLAFRSVAAGRHEIVLAGGTEAMSHTPLVLRPEAAEWYAGLAGASGPLEQARHFAQLRPDFLKPMIALERGLTDPISGLGMGQTAEILAHRFGISREEADACALESHRRLVRARDGRRLEGEVEPAFARDGTVHERDDGVRPDTDMDALASLSPAFEKPHGKVTPGNSSQVTDGACWTLVASEAAVERHRLTPLARIVDSAWAALDPSVMGLGPVLCATALLRRRGLSMDEIALWEINEAFAAQVLACLAAWEDADFCREVLGLDGRFGRIDRARLNVDGGAIALGHPVGTSGTRIVLHLANAMRRDGAERGLATECIGGGQGGAMLLEAA
jgi:acetyl-CoA C-acetyltransferase